MGWRLPIADGWCGGPLLTATDWCMKTDWWPRWLGAKGKYWQPDGSLMTNDSLMTH
jgi:hypothetical protein